MQQSPLTLQIQDLIFYSLVLLYVIWRKRDKREYWYALIGCTLLFPFEFYGDKTWLQLDYSDHFVMLWQNFPAMMPFAWGFFFGLPLIIMMNLSKKIDSKPLWLQLLIIIPIFLIWDFVSEYAATSTGGGSWRYWWPKEQMINGVFPWPIAGQVAAFNICLYYANKWALKQSVNVKSWWKGFFIHLTAYYFTFAFLCMLWWYFNCIILGVQPIPHPARFI